MTEAANYVEFPLTMAHPGFKASKPMPVPGSEIRDGAGHVVRQDYRGTPERFPPVTVANSQEEEYYVSQGYERAGKIDPSAWVKAHSDAPPDEYVPQKYPLWRDGVLYITAQEDPGASADDLRPQDTAEDAKTAPAPPQGDGEAETLRAMVEQMNETMKKMSEQMAETQGQLSRSRAENETLAAEAARAKSLEALLDQATAPATAEAAKPEAAAPDEGGVDKTAEADKPARPVRKAG